MRGFSFIEGRIISIPLRNKFYDKMTNAPKVKDKPTLQSKPLSF
ncbi:hypothetical protein N200_07755 [Helicobacter pylori UM065]|nr:hypothetical protein N200_07755 [Helicobacter pylori UM065]